MGRILLFVAIIIGRWNYIQSYNRVTLITCLVVLIVVTGYQMIVPDSLISSMGTTIIVWGAYMNHDAPCGSISGHQRSGHKGT